MAARNYGAAKEVIPVQPVDPNAPIPANEELIAKNLSALLPTGLIIVFFSL